MLTDACRLLIKNNVGFLAILGKGGFTGGVEKSKASNPYGSSVNPEASKSLRIAVRDLSEQQLTDKTNASAIVARERTL